MQKLQRIFVVLKVQLKTANYRGQKLLKRPYIVVKDYNETNTVTDYKSFLIEMMIRSRNYSVSNILQLRIQTNVCLIHICFSHHYTCLICVGNSTLRKISSMRLIQRISLLIQDVFQRV